MITEELKHVINNYIKKNLSLNIKEQVYQSSSEPYECGSSYTFQLILDGEIISEEYLVT